MSLPLQKTATDSILNEWAGAHSRLLEEEQRLVDLCRRLANFEISPEQLASHREQVASLRARSETLYAQVMEWLQGPS